MTAVKPDKPTKDAPARTESPEPAAFAREPAAFAREPAAYQSFYGFRRRPFSLTANRECFYPSAAHVAALENLHEALRERRPLAALTGETGAGKSSLVQKLIEDAGPEYHLLYSTNTDFHAGDLRNWVVSALNLEPDSDASDAFYRVLIDRVRELNAQGQHLVLLLDEAQQLADDALQEFVAMHDRLAAAKLQVSALLVGQNDLATHLRRVQLDFDGTPVAVSAHLDALDEAETRAYIRYRNQACGGSEDLFTDSACTEVYRQSGGIARVINLVCDAALVYGFAELSPIINAALVKAVEKDGQAEEGEGDLGVWIGNQAEVLNEMDNVDRLLARDPEDSQEMAAVSPTWDDPGIDGAEVARYTRMFFEEDYPHISMANRQPHAPLETAPEDATLPAQQPEPWQPSIILDDLPPLDKGPRRVSRWGRFFDGISLVLVGAILVVTARHWDELPFREHTGDISAYILQVIADAQHREDR